MMIVVMIYSIFLIDADSGVLIVDSTFKKMAHAENEQPQVLAGFFQTLNSTIDDIHTSMRKGRDLSNMNRILASEGATVILHYQPEGRILFASISDADDNTDKILDCLKILSRRFWKKHHSDVEQFRINSQKDIFKSFLIELQIMTLNGTIGEEFPKLSVSDSSLNRIHNMGMISKQEWNIAKMCNGSLSPLQISRKMNLHQSEVTQALKRLQGLDIIKYEKS